MVPGSTFFCSEPPRASTRQHAISNNCKDKDMRIVMTSTGRQTPHESPERGSLRATLLENSNRRLYTHPLEWTPDHLPHLGYRLHVLSPHNKDSSEGLKITLNSRWREALGAIENVEHCSMKHNRDKNMRDLVRQLSLEAGLNLKWLVSFPFC